LQASLFGSQAGDSEAEKEANLQQESRARIAKVQAERAAEYVRDKPLILAKVEALLASNQPNEALAAANKYFAVNKDPDLARLQSRASLGVMKFELQSEANVPLARRNEIYTTLITEEPGGLARYQARLKAVTAELELEQQARARAAERVALEASIKSQLSPWDGSHRHVERALKARMKNPASYEHVETRYSVGTDSITVVTTYRGTNSFGAVVPNQAIATVDKAGNVLTLSDN
jgi:chaperone required for assembly of F1-ATPase